MREIYEEKIHQMIDNFEQMKKPFKWENELTRHLLALVFSMKERNVDTDKIASVKEYIKKSTGVFSPFRGMMMFAISGLVCASSDNPTAQVDRMLTHEGAMKTAGFKNATYLPTALYALTSVFDEEAIKSHIEKASEVYKEMKHNHPILTNGDDYALAVLLAGSDHSPELLEEYYTELNKHGFTKSNGLQMMSHILAFSKKDVRTNVDWCVHAYGRLKEEKLKLYPDYFSAIALLNLLDGDMDALVHDLIEVASYLRNQKKYKWLGKGMNILMASAIISSVYVEERTKETVMSAALSVSVEAIIAAQQAAMIAAVTASTAAATTAAT